MAFCEEHKEFDNKLDHVITVINRLDHGLNGTNGSIGLVERVEKMEAVIIKNSPVWSRMRGLGGNLSIITRTLLIAGFMVLGGYLWGIIMDALQRST